MPNYSRRGIRIDQRSYTRRLPRTAFTDALCGLDVHERHEPFEDWRQTLSLRSEADTVVFGLRFVYRTRGQIDRLKIPEFNKLVPQLGTVRYIDLPEMLSSIDDFVERDVLLPGDCLYKRDPSWRERLYRSDRTPFRLWTLGPENDVRDLQMSAYLSLARSRTRYDTFPPLARAFADFAAALPHSSISFIGYYAPDSGVSSETPRKPQNS